MLQARAMKRLLMLPCVALAACTTSTPSTPSDAGHALVTTDAGSNQPDAAMPPDAGVHAYAEMEPNNGTTMTEFNSIELPAVVTGSIGVPDDVDVMGAQLNAGEFWTWELKSVGGGFVPHLAVVQSTNHVPLMVAIGTASSSSVQEHFVLESGRYFIPIRDARNVPASSSQHVGGAGVLWQLNANRTQRTPTPITFPSTVPAMLAGRNKIDLYSFTATGAGLDIVLNAQRLPMPSDMDSRISLFDKTHNTYVQTNDDDAAANTKDSHLGGALPAADYVLVVENVDPAASNFHYELVLTLR